MSRLNLMISVFAIVLSGILVPIATEIATKCRDSMPLLVYLVDRAKVLFKVCD